MKLLIIFGVCLAICVQVSVQLPFDRKVLPLPTEDDRILKTFAKIDDQKPPQTLNIKADNVINDKMNVETINIKDDERMKDKIEAKADEYTDKTGQQNGESKRKFIKDILDKIGRKFANRNQRGVILVNSEDDTNEAKAEIKVEKYTETDGESITTGESKRTFIKKILDKIGKNLANRNPRDVVVVDEVYVYDDNALTDEELVDLVMADAVADVVVNDDYRIYGAFNNDDMTEFPKREKRWSFCKSLKKRVKEILDALSKA